MAKKVIARPKNLDEALKSIRSNLDLTIGSIDELGLDVEGVTTGNAAIDYLTGVGLPKGRIIELYGLPSSGKTTCALQAAARLQKEGKNILFIDFEYALDPAYCAALGLDLHDPTFLVTQPDSFEQGINAMRQLIGTGEIAMTILDSVAAAPIEKELEIETGGSTFADKAKLMAQTMRQLTGPVAKNDVVCVFLNHVRDKIDTSPMGQKMAAAGIKQKTTPGGVALDYHASVRIEFQQVGKVKGKWFDANANETREVPLWTKVKVSIPKNKVGAPMRSAETRIKFGAGFSEAYQTFAMLVAYGVIKKKGAMYTFTEAVVPPDGRDKLKGEASVIGLLEANPEWLAHCTDLAATLMKEHGYQAAALPLEEDDGEEQEEDKVSSEELDEAFSS